MISASESLEDLFLIGWIERSFIDRIDIMRSLHELRLNKLFETVLENDSIGSAVDFIVSNAGIYGPG